MKTQFGFTALLHGIEDAQFSRGSTPDFDIWERGDDWGHVEHGRATQFNPATGAHDRLPEVSSRRAELDAWRAA